MQFMLWEGIIIYQPVEGICTVLYAVLTQVMDVAAPKGRFFFV